MWRGGGWGGGEPYHSIQLGDGDAQSVGQLGGGEERLQTAVDVGEQVCHVRAAKLLKLGFLSLVERRFLRPAISIKGFFFPKITFNKHTIP